MGPPQLSKEGVRASHFVSNMPSFHATMGLLLLRVTSTVAWTPAAVRLNRVVAARSTCRHCPRSPASARSSSSGSRSRRCCSGGNGFRTFATVPPTATGAIIDGEGGNSEGCRDGNAVGEQEDGAAAASVNGKDFGGVEIQPLLQRHMETLGSAGRRK